MSQSVWGYWLIALGIGVITVMMLVQNYTTINQEDYYLLKEVTQASMVDAIDYNHYRQHGEIKINREKFIENFTRRFASVVKGNKNYKLDFYDIYETPPKVSVKVSTKTSSFNVSGDTMDLDVTNSIDAILENNSTNTITETFYSVPYGPCYEESQDYLGYCTVTNSPTLSQAGIIDYILEKIDNPEVQASDIKLLSAKYIGPMTTQEEFNIRNAMFDDVYEYEGGSGWDASGRPIEQQIANEIKNVKLTVTDNNILAWSGKYKCQDDYGKTGPGSLRGFGPGSVDTYGNNIEGQCLIGIKYELKFSY